MKKTLLIIPIVFFAFASCKKNVVVPMGGPVVLLDHVYHTYSGGVDTITYKYDAGNRLIEHKSTGAQVDYIMKYDSQGRIIEEDDYNTITPSYSVQYLYVYNTDNTVTSTLITKNNGVVASSRVRTLTFNGNNQMIKLDPGNGGGIQTYAYDGRGNEVTFILYLANPATAVSTQSDYTYDQNRSPLSNIQGGLGQAAVNNPTFIKTTVYSSPGVVLGVSTFTYTYQYNSNGYPTSETKVSVDGLNGNRVTNDSYVFFYK